MPSTVTKSDGSCSLTYTYLSDGTKVRAKVDGGFGSAYKGGFIYTVTRGGGLDIESVAWDEGRIIIGSDGTVAQDQ